MKNSESSLSLSLSLSVLQKRRKRHAQTAEKLIPMLKSVQSVKLCIIVLRNAKEIIGKKTTKITLFWCPL